MTIERTMKVKTRSIGASMEKIGSSRKGSVLTLAKMAVLPMGTM